jgi:hypothetical protein
VCELFLRLEQEELQHASRVRLLAARYRHDTRLLGPSLVPPELDEMLADAEQAVRSIRQGTFAATAAEALSRVAALEARFDRAHAELIAADGHPALREFFRKLAAQDRAHHQLLAGPTGSRTPLAGRAAGGQQG